MTDKAPEYLLLKDYGSDGVVVERFPNKEALEKYLNPLSTSATIEVYRVIEQMLTVRNVSVVSDASQKKGEP